MVFKKGQAALDFLMTYGWAIALVVIIAAVLFAMGVFDTSNFIGSKAAGFSGVAVSSWNLNSAGGMQIKVSNQVGKKIEIQNITAKVGTLESNNTTKHNLTTGEATTFDFSGFGAANVGNSYTSVVTIIYKELDSGFLYTTTGTLTGKVA